MNTLLLVVAGLGAVVVVGLLVQYNGLVAMRQMVKNAWADVDVYLKRRAELIPNLVTAVKAYAGHEQTVLEALAEARSTAAALSAPDDRKSQAEAGVALGLQRVLLLAESYPDLKASGNFLDLQKELSETERLIASARQYYNACVRDFNTKIEAFPSSLVAGLGGFRHAEFFEAESPLEREAPELGRLNAP